ncbi:MAG: phage protein D [Cyanobacteria bacterium SIG32]|nr:phage protein D [Cyanobacteria bacterium SIG32]
MYKPIFKIEYNQKDITKDVSNQVLNIEYTDYEHGQSDEITITFDDTQKLWQSSWIPSKGDSLRVFIGYEGEKLLNCGVFEIDEIEFATPPDILTVKALATGITKALRQNNSVAYENKTLKQIASEIAQKHSLTLVGEIEDVRVERITQNQERDLTFLKKLAEQYGYIFKIAEGNLVFYKTEKLTGADAAKILYRTDLSRISLTEKTSKNYKAVTVSYHNPKTGKKITATAKNEKCVKGDTLKITERCENKQQALLKAKAALAKGNNTIEGSIDLVGTPNLIAGLNIELKDLGYFSGKYHITQTRHFIDRTSGYGTSLEVKSC